MAAAYGIEHAPSPMEKRRARVLHDHQVELDELEEQVHHFTYAKIEHEKSKERINHDSHDDLHKPLSPRSQEKEMHSHRMHYAAVFWHKKADDSNIAAQCFLATLYEDPEGSLEGHVHCDVGKAAALYTRAAGQGNLTAQCNLGDMYMEGVGVRKAPKQAADWYLKAADQESIDAQARLGALYELGQGVDYNLERALEWYNKAAGMNSQEAQVSFPA
jgi:TPR repeat protein